MNIPPLLEITPPAEEPIARVTAKRIISRLLADFHHRAKTHVELYQEFWDSSATPDEILTEINAILEADGHPKNFFKATATESAMHLSNMATAVGKVVTDFIPASYLVPRRQLLEAEDGTVYLAPPAEGFDAWGKPITTNPEPLENDV
jgi:hypothetical protein